MSKTDHLRIKDYLDHMLEALKRIHHYIEDMIELTFIQNELVQDAVIRNIEIMGEAARNIERYHPDFANQNSEVPWKEIYLMRNRVSHGYFSVDLEVVWNTLQNDLPELEKQIQKIHQSLK